MNEYIDQDAKDLFSIHSHSFNAQSWIIAGDLINHDYEVNRNSESPNSALFKVEYNKTLNEVNQHQSRAINTQELVKVDEMRKTVFHHEDSYKINKGDFHKSMQRDPTKLTATLFSFYLDEEELIQSEVTGPIDIIESKINRKMHIDPTSFIDSINELI